MPWAGTQKKGCLLFDEPGAAQQPPIAEIVNGEPDEEGKDHDERAFGLVLGMLEVALSELGGFEQGIVGSSYEEHLVGFDTRAGQDGDQHDGDIHDAARNGDQCADAEDGEGQIHGAGDDAREGDVPVAAGNALQTAGDHAERDEDTTDGIYVGLPLRPLLEFFSLLAPCQKTGFGGQTPSRTTRSNPALPLSHGADAPIAGPHLLWGCACRQTSALILPESA